MSARIPRQSRSPEFIGSVADYVARYWRACGMTEGEIAEALDHLVIEIDYDGTVTLTWDDPSWLGAG